MNLADRHWELIAAYLAVVRTGSLSAAGRAIGQSQPTLRRHIAELEAITGTTLFSRSPTGLMPTDAARALVPQAEAMEAAAAAFLRAASADEGEDAGRVRLTCPDVFGAEILPPVLARMAADHPRLSVELVLSNRTEDLLTREADVGVRTVRPTQGALIARKVAPVEIGIFVRPGPLAERLRRLDYDSFAREGPFVGDDRRPAIARGFAALGRTAPKALILRTDSDLAQLAAIRAGVGAGVCQVGLAQRSGLVRLFPEVAPRLEVWVVMHEDMARLHRIRSVFDTLVAALH